MADRQGFEPWRRSPAYTLSRRAPSTTRPPVRAASLPNKRAGVQEGFTQNLQPRCFGPIKTYLCAFARIKTTAIKVSIKAAIAIVCDAYPRTKS